MPVAERPPTGRLTSPVLVGRDNELSVLVHAVTQPPAFVVLEGEAGVGKTRLVDELMASPELGDRHRFKGGCQQLREPFPLGPVVEALRDAPPTPEALSPVVGALRPLLPELADRLPPTPDPLGDRRGERHRLFRALRELLGALGPSVLVLEDLHWDDGSTVELLRFLTPQLPPELTLVCTYRREDLPTGSPLLGLASRLPREVPGIQISLDPFDRDAVRELVQRILDADDVSNEFAAHLLEDSGGLPFAVEEIVQLLRDREDLVRRRGAWVRLELEEIGVPLELRDAILERVGRLDQEARDLVEAAAVIGTASDEELVLNVADVDDGSAGAALAEALSSALLVEVGQGRLGFRHVLARQAVAEAIAAPVRRRLHLRSAAALEAARPIPHAALAHHYRAGGKHSKWIAHAEAAADRAESLEDDATAYRFLREAVSVPGLSPATRARLAAKLAAHARQCLAHKEAIHILREVLEDKALAPETRGELRIWLVKLLLLEGDPAAADSETIQALEELRGQPAQAADAMLHLAWQRIGMRPIDEQLAWLDRAMGMAARSKDRALRIAVTGHRAAFLLRIGDPRGWPAIAEIPAPGPAADEIDRAARASNNLADALLHLGYLERAEELIRESLELLGQGGYPEQPFAQRITELQRRWLVGDWTGLDEAIRVCLDEWQDLPQLRADPEAVLGLVLLARGQVRAALDLLRPLAENFQGEVPVLAWVSGGLARIKLAEGRPQEAVEATASVLDIVGEQDIWAWATDVAPATVEALLEAGRRADAEELTRRFAAGLRGRDAPAAAAALTICRALLAERQEKLDGAARHYGAAERAWKALPRPYEAARAHEGAGRSLLSGGKAGGGELLVEAMDAFRALGATWDAARVRRTLRDHGVIPPHRRGRKSYEGELSPREAEVARLACEGLSNREIALTLFLSQKTVEGHLRSAMRKLGVTSRNDLPPLLESRSAAKSSNALT